MRVDFFKQNKLTTLCKRYKGGENEKSSRIVLRRYAAGRACAPMEQDCAEKEISPPHSLSNEMRRLCGWIPYTPTKKASVNDVLIKQLKSIHIVLHGCAARRACAPMEQDDVEEEY